MPGAHRRGRPRTAWMDNIKTWTGLSMEESIRMTEDGDKWRNYVHGVANPRIEDSGRLKIRSENGLVSRPSQLATLRPLTSNRLRYTIHRRYRSRGSGTNRLPTYQTRGTNRHSLLYDNHSAAVVDQQQQQQLFCGEQSSFIPSKVCSKQ